MRVRLASSSFDRVKVGPEAELCGQVKPWPALDSFCLVLRPYTGWVVMMCAVCLARLGNSGSRYMANVPDNTACHWMLCLTLVSPRAQSPIEPAEPVWTTCLRLFGPNSTSRLCSASGNCVDAIQRPTIPTSHFPLCICTSRLHQGHGLKNLGSRVDEEASHHASSRSGDALRLPTHLSSGSLFCNLFVG